MISLIDSAGTSVVEYTYDAWGRVFPATGTLASTLGQANPFRYRGYYFDTESGFYYLQSRYYDPMTGRFINADDTSILQMTQGELLGGNLYAYCGNNGVMNVDPDGYVIRTNPVSQTDNPTKDSFYYPWLFVGTRSFQRPFLQYDTIFGYWISRLCLFWPVKGYKLNRNRYLEDDDGKRRNFGPRTHPISNIPNTPHKGIDIGAKEKTEIIAVAIGKVIGKFKNMDKQNGAGYALIIEHDLGNGMVIRTNYYHMYRPSMKNVGDKVFAGEVIGYVGNTGASTDPHLHFGVSVSDKQRLKYIGTKGLSYKDVRYSDWSYIDPLIFNYK